MKRRELERLLGEYSAGTLSEAEQRALYEAALQDQTVFDALADEQALKELLDDAEVRRRLLEALTAARSSWRERMASWLRRPPVWATAGCAASLLIAVAVMVSGRKPPGGVQVAWRAETPAPPTAISPPPSPAAEPVRAPQRAARPAPARTERAAPKPVAPAAIETAETLEERREAVREFRPPEFQAPAPVTVEAPPPEIATGAAVRESHLLPPTPAPQIPPPATPVAQPLSARTLIRVAPREALGVVLYRRVPEGQFVEAHLQTALHAGDQIRIAVTPPADGTLTVMLEEGGVRRPVFSGAVRKGQQRLIPEGEPILLQGERGKKRLVLVLGRPRPSPFAATIQDVSAARLPITVEVPLNYGPER